jgi:hypothetical protein
MNNFLKEKYRHLIWQDELGEPFLLLKFAEIFEYSETTLGLYCWSDKMLSVLRSKGLILTEKRTDDPLYVLTVDKCHLELLISLGSFKKRPDLKGKWIMGREKLLAHKIITFRRKLESEETIDLSQQEIKAEYLIERT